MTVTKRNAKDEIEMSVKRGKEIKVRKVTDKRLSGEGTRLGTAYQLKDGKVVYVPE